MMNNAFQQLFSQLTQSAVILGFDQKITAVNEAFEARFQNDTEAVIGSDPNSVKLIPRNKVKARKLIDLVEKQIDTDQGSLLIVKNSPRQKKSPVGKEYYLRTLAEHIPRSNFALIIPGFTISVAKGRALETYGCKRERLEGYNLKDVLRPSALENFLNPLEKAFNRKEFTENLSLNNRDFEVEFVPVFDEYGDVESVLFISQDITLQKEARVERARAEKLQLTRNILRNIAHEVRNPLTNINLASEELKDTCAQVPGGEMFFDIIDRNTHRINKLVTEIMQFTKTPGIVPEPVKVEELLRKVQGTIEDRIKLREITFLRRNSCKELELKIDKGKMTMALGNIAINAIEAVETGTGKVSIRAWKTGDELIVSISDNGVGMDKETLGKIYDPFHTGKSSGMGLGLTGAFNVIKAHDGEVKVESTPGKGTTFFVRLKANK